jgi:hypothetical protein
MGQGRPSVAWWLICMLNFLEFLVFFLAQKLGLQVDISKAFFSINTLELCNIFIASSSVMLKVQHLLIQKF